ncbi:sigma-70 factor domain-containing protein, partial [Kibdelosporangium lantanae]
MTVPQTVDQEVPDVTMELDLDAQGPAADLVRVYLNGIGKTALLTAAQEVELAKRIEAGVFAQHMLESAPELA